MFGKFIGMPSSLVKNLLRFPVFPVIALLASWTNFHVGAQEPLVTFYTHGRGVRGMPGTKNGVFFGAIYDKDKAMVYFHEGFIVKNDRFVTFHLPAGDHDFSASYSKDASKEHHIRIPLESGQHYFFRASSESRGIVVVESEKGRLDQVSCQIAQDEARFAKPLSPKHPTSYLLSSRITETSFPGCN